VIPPYSMMAKCEIVPGSDQVLADRTHYIAV